MRANAVEIERRLTSLRDDSLRLAGAIRTAARRLRDDAVSPSWDFIDELGFYRTRYVDLHRDLTGAHADENPPSLDDLGHEVARLHRFENVLATLSRIADASSRDGDTNPAVDALRNAAQHTIDHLRVDDDGWQQIEAGTGIGAVPVLVDQADQLDDEQWDAAYQSIETTLGRSVAIALVRQRIHLPPRPSGSPESAEGGTFERNNHQ